MYEYLTKRIEDIGETSEEPDSIHEMLLGQLLEVSYFIETPATDGMLTMAQKKELLTYVKTVSMILI